MSQKWENEQILHILGQSTRILWIVGNVHRLRHGLRWQAAKQALQDKAPADFNTAGFLKQHVRM
jgi:hypothetical protein